MKRKRTRTSAIVPEFVGDAQFVGISTSHNVVLASVDKEKNKTLQLGKQSEWKKAS